MIEKKLLTSVVPLDGEENYLELNEEVKTVKEQRSGIELLKKI